MFESVAWVNERACGVCWMCVFVGLCVFVCVRASQSYMYALEVSVLFFLSRAEEMRFNCSIQQGLL